jgi:hypothetical protein
MSLEMKIRGLQMFLSTQKKKAKKKKKKKEEDYDILFQIF